MSMNVDLGLVSIDCTPTLVRYNSFSKTESLLLVFTFLHCGLNVRLIGQLEQRVHFPKHLVRIECQLKEREKDIKNDSHG